LISRVVGSIVWIDWRTFSTHGRHFGSRMVIRKTLEKDMLLCEDEQYGVQCGGVLWRREVVENDVEAESKKGGTYDLTF
jgi:hypothetical protein